MNLVPLGDRVVVQALEQSNTLASGIVIPDTAQEKPQKGVVIAVGPGKHEKGELIPIDANEGDEILYSKYGGTEIEIDRQPLVVLRESDILAKLN